MFKRLTPEQAVVVGSKVKATLQRLEVSNPGLVRVDWLRFTVPLDAVVMGCPELPLDLQSLSLLTQKGRDVVRMARAAGIEHDALGAALQVTRSAAAYLVHVLGCALEVGQSEDRGMDYYSCRTALLHAGEVVGWVLAGGKSQAQAGTVHFNLFGSALLNIPPASLLVLRAWLESSQATITRVDLSLDVWQGLDITTVPAAWHSGAFDVRGKRPKQSEAGSWTAGHSRTFYVGSRASGKLCRVYEKGHELFGHESGDPWVRIEVEYRNACRLIDYGVLDRPGDYFAGAYSWTADRLADAAAQFEAQKLTMTVGSDALKEKTAEAAVSRVVRWIKRTAAPAVAAYLEHAHESFFDLMEGEFRVAGRLRGFDRASIVNAFESVAAKCAPSPVPA